MPSSDFTTILQKRRRELNELADLLEGEYKKLGILKNIPWLSSQKRTLVLLHKNYSILVMDLESKSYGDSDGAKKSLGYLEFLKQPKFLIYLGFLIDLVNSLSKLSELFQANMLLICEIRRCTEEKAAAIEGLYLSLGSTLMKMQEEVEVVDGETKQEGDIKYQGVVLDRPTRRISDIVQLDPMS